MRKKRFKPESIYEATIIITVHLLSVNLIRIMQVRWQMNMQMNMRRKKEEKQK